jgi:hypothetical protein
VFAPGLFGPLNEDPSTITDFKGFVGLAFINGLVDVYQADPRRFIKTFPFLNTDMRFMTGRFIDTRGRRRRGTFVAPAAGGGWADALFQGANCKARMSWTARGGNTLYISRPLRTSTTTFAEFGWEANGSFKNDDDD